MTSLDSTNRRVLRIGVLDNDRLALESIVAILQRLNNRAGRRLDVWATDQPAQAIQECRFGSQQTSIIIVDMALTGTSGPQVATTIRQHVPNIGIIGITSYELGAYHPAMQEAGAQALLDKGKLHEVIIPAIDRVSRGLNFPEDSDFDDVKTAQQEISNHRSSLLQHHLTSTEQKILALSLSHLDAKTIAAQLNVSVNTVFSHRRNIKRKFDATTWHDALDICRYQHLA